MFWWCAVDHHRWCKQAITCPHSAQVLRWMWYLARACFIETLEELWCCIVPGAMLVVCCVIVSRLPTAITTVRLLVVCSTSTVLSFFALDCNQLLGWWPACARGANCSCFPWKRQILARVVGVCCCSLFQTITVLLGGQPCATVGGRVEVLGLCMCIRLLG